MNAELLKLWVAVLNMPMDLGVVIVDTRAACSFRTIKLKHCP